MYYEIEDFFFKCLLLRWGIKSYRGSSRIGNTPLAASLIYATVCIAFVYLIMLMFQLCLCFFRSARVVFNIEQYNIFDVHFVYFYLIILI